MGQTHGFVTDCLTRKPSNQPGEAMGDKVLVNNKDRGPSPRPYDEPLV
ncbi:MAG: hypothetical protein H6667_02470 [Ardenticatenaceae bacterium]|nr:hypothetical protein [Ardenticatenaceae bacterium]